MIGSPYFSIDEVMEEDDDVVFENSPLYQHLKEIGMAGNFESPSHARTIVQARTKKQTYVSQLIRLLVVLKSWFEHVTSYILPKTMREKSLNLAVRVALLNSKVLMYGDHQWLLSYGLQEKNTDQIQQPASKVLIIANSAIFGSIACLWFLLRNSPTNLATSKLMMVVVFLLTSTLIGLGHLATFTMQCYYDNKRAYLGRMLFKQLKLMENMESCIKKCLRNIQEAELIARGFTIISHKVPLMKLENSSLLGRSKRQLQQLRVAVFKASLSQFLAYRESTRYLLQKIRLQSEVDNVANYIANVSEEDLGFKGDIMKNVKENWSEEDQNNLAEASDNFSLSAIKIVWQTMAVQRSEFMRRFGLSVCPNAWDTNGKDFSHFMPILEQVTTSLLSDTQRNYQELNRVSEIHKIGTNKQDQDVCRTSSLESASKGQYGELWTAAHSLYLHLQAAAVRVHALQERCHSLNQEDSDPCEKIQKELNSLLETVNPELKASLSCYQEVETNLKRLNTSTSSDIPTDPNPTRDNSNNIPPQPIKLFGWKDEEIRFDDETFEAYTDPDEINPDGGSSHGNFHQEETLKQRKERQASLQLLLELRSVLPGRMAVREQLKQKGRKNNVEDKEVDADNCIENVMENQRVQTGENHFQHKEVSTDACIQNLVENHGTKSKEVYNDNPDSGDHIFNTDPCKDGESTNSDEDTSTNDNPRTFANEVADNQTDQSQSIAATNHFELESMERDMPIENLNGNCQTSQPPPQFGGLWGMASLASQAASMSSNFQQQEEIFGSDSEMDESE